MQKYLGILLPTFLALAGAARSFAAGFDLPLTGRLTEKNGKPVDGPVELSISFFHAAKDGAPILTVTDGLSSVMLQEGIFQVSVKLSGSDWQHVFPSADQAVFIEITDVTHAAGTPYPRFQVAMAPLAGKVPVDGKTIAFDGEGRAGLVVAGAQGAGKLLSSDGAGALAWTDPPSAAVTQVSGVSAASVAAGATAANDATSTSAAGSIVKRDANGGFAASSLAAESIVLTAASASSKPLSVKGAAAQTANLQEWLSSTGTMLAGISADGALKLGSGAHSMSLKAPSGMSSNTSYVLPAAPDDGKFLMTDANGNLSWSAPTIASAGLAPSLGSEGAPSYSFSGDANTGMWSSGADTVNVSTGGTERLRVDASGRVGIGTTSPAANLTVQRDTATTDNSSLLLLKNNSQSNFPYAGLTLDTNQANGGAYVNFNMAGVARGQLTYVANGQDILSVQNSQAGPIVLKTDATERVRVDSAGSVGIGTTSPSALLHAYTASNGFATVGKFETYSSTAGFSDSLRIDVSANGTRAAKFVQSDNGTDYSSFTFNINSMTMDVGNFGGTSLFAVKTNGSQRLIVDTDGKVGIGTATPAYPLDVNGTVRATNFISTSGTSAWGSSNLTDIGSLGIGTTSTSNSIGLGGSTARSIGMDRHSTANTAGNILTVSAGGATSGATDKNGGDLVVSSGVATGTGASSISFKTATAQGSTATTDNTPSTKMTITGTGNVGIGTTTPSYILDISQNTSGVAGFRIANSTSGAAAQVQNRLENNAGGVAYYGITSSDFTTAPIIANRAFFGSSGVDTAIWTQSSHNIIFGTGGLAAVNERMRIDTVGNVGIGTTAPLQALEISRPSSSGYPFQLRIGSGEAGAAYTYDIGRNPTSGLLTFYGNQSGDNGYIFSGTNGERMRIDNVGNVGIGTTSPAAKLEVKVDDAGTSSLADALILSHTTSGTAAAGFGTAVRFYGERSDGASAPMGYIASVWESALASSEDASLAFGTVRDSAAPVERLRLKSDGSMQLGGSTNALSGYTFSVTDGSSLVNSGHGRDLIVAAGTSDNAAAKHGGSLYLRPGAPVSPATEYGNVVLADQGGSVGLGTTSPLTRLHLLAGTGGGSTPAWYGAFGYDPVAIENSDHNFINMISLANKQGGILFSDDTRAQGQLIYEHTDDSMRLGTAGTERVRINSSGSVGIGTTTPGYTLDVNGTVRATSFVTAGNTTVDGQAARSITSSRNTTADTAGNDLTMQAGGAASGATDKAGGTLAVSSGIATGTGGSSINFNTATPQGSTSTSDNTPSTKMTITGAGSVGIGTTAPAAKFHVAGDAIVNSSMYVTNNFLHLWSGGGEASTGVKVGDSNDVFSVGDAAGNAGAGSSRLYVGTNGNVGIGTTSPSGAVDVTKSTSGAIGPILHLYNSASTANGNGVDIAMSGNPGGGASAPTGRIRLVEDGMANSTMSFWTYGGGGSISQRMTILPAGNVGVGTTSPSAQLHIGANTGYGTTTGLLVAPNLPGNSYDRAYQIAPVQTAAPSGNSILMYLVPTISSGVTVPSMYGIYADSKQGSGSITNYYPAVLMGGNVGIGTTAPSSLLEIAGTAKATAFNLGLAGEINNTFNGLVVSANYGLALMAPTTEVTSGSTSGPVFISKVTNGGFVGNFYSTSFLGTDVFHVNQTGGAYFAGNVGIGTTAPDGVLHLVNPQYSNAWSLRYNAASGVNANRLSWYNSTTETFFIDGNNINSTSTIGFNSTVLSIGPNGTAGVAIKNDGNVGVGTTAPNSKLQVAGAIATAIATKTSAYTLTSSDSTIFADGTTAAFTVTLPTAVGVDGRTYRIKKKDGSANAITIATTSSQTIDGAGTYVLPTQYKYVEVQSDGANWAVVANN